MKRIKVMRIIARMNVGGPAVQISGLMRGLDSSKFDQVLVTGQCAEDEADYIETQGQDVEALRIQGLGRAINFRDDIRAFRELQAVIRDFQPDIIHTHTAKAGVVGRMAALTSHRKAHLVHTFHGHLLNGYFPPAKTRVVVEVGRKLAKQTQALISVGEKVRDDLLNAGIGTPEKFRIIPPGLVLPSQPAREDARAALGLIGNNFTVAFIGRITNIKRPDRFLEVVRSIQQQTPDVNFLVAGAGNLEPEMRECVEREGLPVTLLGWRSDVETVLAASDALILTSDNEGTPLSLIQAGMAGLPVVSTNVGSVREIVRDNVTGFLCPLDADELSSTLLRLVNDPAQAHEMGAQGKEFTDANFGVSRLVRDHENLYLSLRST